MAVRASSVFAQRLRPRRKPFICSNCRAVSRRAQSTAASQNAPPAKPYYVTTPIFYVNGAPHLGHLYSLVLADTIKRWQVFRSKRAILSTGTDEHGQKVQQAAHAKEWTPQDFCDEMHQAFKSLADEANVGYDRFIRTTDRDHCEAVQHFWSLLSQRGAIDVKKHEGFYSVSDEAFVPIDKTEKALDPSTGRVHYVSTETGGKLEWTSETNYFFRLSEYRDELLKFYRENPQFVVPNTRMFEIVREVETGLRDISISRPTSRLAWGVPVPGDDSQTIYVWIDALVNYLTVTGWPRLEGDSQPTSIWPADCHVVGKDIARFHCIYWPALLMAAGERPPKQVLAHAHWHLGDRKMSKSTGNVVNPFFALQRYGLDAVRWFLIQGGGLKDDAAYENSLVESRYSSGLRNGLGNLLSRVAYNTQGHCDVIAAVQAFDVNTTAELDVQFSACLRDLPDAVASHMDELQTSKALLTIMNVVYDTNVYITRMQPWTLKKAENAARVRQVIFLCAESLRICAILLQPFMPKKAAHMLDVLNVAPDRRQFEHAAFRSDETYGRVDRKGEREIVFPPVSVDGKYH